MRDLPKSVVGFKTIKSHDSYIWQWCHFAVVFQYQLEARVFEVQLEHFQ